MSDEAILENEFQYGEYHEEEISWDGLAEKLSTEDVVSLALPVIRHFIASEYREGTDEMAVITSFYRSLDKWAKNRLKEPAEILSACAEMRKLLAKKCDPRSLSWRIDNVRSFSLVEMAIQGRMGMMDFDLKSKYSSIIDDLVSAR